VRGTDVLAVGVVGLLVFTAAMLAMRARAVSRLRKRLEPHVRVAGAEQGNPARRQLLRPRVASSE
jgi:hypothetical protein